MGARLAVIADDLTGAADSAAGFASTSPVVLLVDTDLPWPERGAVALDLDTRYATDAVARRRASIMATRADRAGYRVFKKVDSLARGHLAVEVEATLRALRQAHARVVAILAPSFPALGRTTEGGVIHDNGRPVTRHGRPVYLPDLFADVGLTVAPTPRPASVAGFTTHVQHAASAGVDVLVVDALDQEDLATVAAAAAALPAPDLLLVGAGGLARALADHAAGGRAVAPTPTHLAGPRLFVVGSRSDAAYRQRQALVATGALSAPLSPTIGAAAMADHLRAGLRAGQDAVVFPDPALPVDPANAAQVSALLADAAAALLDVAGTVVLTGGETARAVLTRAGITRLHVLGELEPGVVLGTPPDRTLHVVTKAGSFGDEEVLLRHVTPSTRRRAE